MSKRNKFSDLVTNLTEVWILWMKNNTACKDDTLPIKIRKEAADACEALIDRRDAIVSEMDSFFPSS